MKWIKEKTRRSKGHTRLLLLGKIIDVDLRWCQQAAPRRRPLASLSAAAPRYRPPLSARRSLANLSIRRLLASLSARRHPPLSARSIPPIRLSVCLFPAHPLPFTAYSYLVYFTPSTLPRPQPNTLPAHSTVPPRPHPTILPPTAHYTTLPQPTEVHNILNFFSVKIIITQLRGNIMNSLESTNLLLLSKRPSFPINSHQ